MDLTKECEALIERGIKDLATLSRKEQENMRLLREAEEVFKMDWPKAKVVKIRASDIISSFTVADKCGIAIHSSVTNHPTMDKSRRHVLFMLLITLLFRPASRREIQDAARQGDLERIHAPILCGADANDKSYGGFTTLQGGATYPRKNVAALLRQE